MALGFELFPPAASGRLSAVLEKLEAHSNRAIGWYLFAVNALPCFDP
jgi:hypothetical protein